MSLPADPLDAFQSLSHDLTGPPLKTAIVHPVDTSSLTGAIDAMEAGHIEPVLVGPEARINTAAEQADLDISAAHIVDVPHSHAAAQKAVKLARNTEVSAIMKGALHTNELMEACVDGKTGLRTDRRMSHVFVMDASGYSKYLLITDGALNIAPNLIAKSWIVQNAIDLAQAIGIERPLTAILSATEEVDPLIPSTLDAAALCKMADRGQITGGVLDGPLAFDVAVSAEAVKTKKLVSPVAGKADILVVPNIEAGNMLAKQLDYLSVAAAAGIVLGARVPIILTSRADSPAERVASCVLARRYMAWKTSSS